MSGRAPRPASAADGAAGVAARRYGKAAGLLSVGIGATGVLTYVFFSLASHSLSADEYGEVVVLWSVVFVTVVTLYRPVEQLLSRTIADRDARGERLAPALRVAAKIQLALALAFAIVAFALRGPLEGGLFEGNALLYWVLIGSVLAFAASFFARGLLAGSRRFSLYATLLLIESTTRLCFALAVAVGIAGGQSLIAIAIVAAPVISLVVAPLAVIGARSRAAPVAPRRGPEAEFTLAHGGGFAGAVLVIMFSEQTFLNAGTLLVRAAEGAAAAGFIFNVLMVARAPLYLFQAVATSLLPHLTRLLASGREDGESAFRLSVRSTLVAVAAFTAVVLAVVAVAGPELMQLAFGDKFTYGRADLLIIATGMGLYLSAVTFNQAALAQGKVRRAAICWIVCAAGFVGWNLLPVLDVFRRVEVGFAGAAAALCLLLYLLYRRPRERSEDVVQPDSPEEIEARLAAADEAS